MSVNFTDNASMRSTRLMAFLRSGDKSNVVKLHAGLPFTYTAFNENICVISMDDAIKEVVDTHFAWHE